MTPEEALREIRALLGAAGYASAYGRPDTVVEALRNLRAGYHMANDELAAANARIKLDAMASHHPNPDSPSIAELKRKLHAAHRELDRRRRRDEELSAHMPVIAARLQSMAADAALDLRGAKEPGDRWDVDKAIDWTGIDGGHP